VKLIIIYVTGNNIASTQGYFAIGFSDVAFDLLIFESNIFIIYKNFNCFICCYNSL